MAEAKNSFIKSKMNKDLDDRLIPNNEYRDALNVAVSRSENSDVGALEAILGNQLRVSESTSTEEVVGVYVDHTNNLAYYFTTDNTGLGKILQYNAGSTTSTLLVSGNFLNFSTNSRINSISLIEDLLFFSDNRNQPRKINVSTALSDNQYYKTEDQISVAKFAPYRAPDFINLRSTNTGIKPSTMSDASDPLQTEIGPLTLTSINLDTSVYRNGDEINQAITQQQWIANDAAGTGCWCYYDYSLGNGVTYGKLYNRHAVKDVRELAPVGFTVMTSAQWLQISGGASPATPLKSTDFWSANPGTNTTGFDALPAGYISDTSNFAGLLDSARFWTRDGVVGDLTGTYVKMESTDQAVTIDSSTGIGNENINGYSVRLIKNVNYNGWNGDPDYLRDKFVKFSYRFKFDDNEYSIVSPFSQDVFIPEQEGQFVNDNETQAFVTTVVEFMQNSVNNAILNIELPSLDILADYKVKGIDIIFKESDKLAYQVLESINVDQDFINNLNNTNIYQYDYQSTLPVKTLPSSESTRVFDKVPVRAIAQETAGNRIMYGNFIEGKSGQRGLDYYAEIVDKTQQTFTEYPQHSLKQNRNYQAGIVLADKFGRQTDIILSNYDNLLDSSGNPQPGSNVFSDYNGVGFNSDVQGWTGDTLSLEFNNVIPEAPLANNVSGYPGAYAVGNYYTIPKPPGNPPGTIPAIFFRDLSTQSITATAAQGIFIFQGLLYSDLGGANTYTVYKNTGNGFIRLAETTDYTLLDNAGSPEVKLVAAGADLGTVIKFQILFTSQNYYKYQTGSTTSADPLFPNFATTYQNFFQLGKTFAGLFTDYVEIESVTSVGSPVTSVVLLTDGEVASKYLFDNTATGRPETPLTQNELPRTYATYTINVDGFYSYKVGVKQQQQDYYNVYLPGIVNGYPIVSSTLEQGETAFTTLVADNINKIPRNLTEVGPLQNQFTSSIRLFGRVTNTTKATIGTNSYRTTQFDPLSSADSVDLVGTIEDVFPPVLTDTSAPASAAVYELVPVNINRNAIYDFDTKPFVAKISTQKSIGITEVLYTFPPADYPYADNMGLAVYETSPFISQLELFYEATTTGLISDLNYDILNTGTGISGISVTQASFPENTPSGSTITPDFFPLIEGQIDNTTTATLVSVFNFAFGSTNLNSINYATGANTQFELEAGTQTGSFFIKTLGFFYAGSDASGIEESFAVSYAGKYIATVRFTQADGTQTDQTIELQLTNSDPYFVASTTTLDIQATPSNVSIYTIATSPSGFNGAIDLGVLQERFAILNGFGWSVVSIRVTTNTGVILQYDNTPNSGNAATNTILDLTSQGLQSPSNSLGFELKSVSGNGNTTGYFYEVTMQLTDNLGASLSVPLLISYGVEADIFLSTQVVFAPYTTGTGFVALPVSGPSNTTMTNAMGSFFSFAGSYPYPRFIGQIQNWTPNIVYIWAYLSIPIQYRSRTQNSVQVLFGEIDNVNGPTQSAGTDYSVGRFVDGSKQTTQSGFTNQSFVQSSSLNQGSGVNPDRDSHTKTLLKLDAFTTDNTLINAGVRPGEKNDGTSATCGAGTFQAYDFTKSAVVNFAVQILGNELFAMGGSGIGARSLTNGYSQSGPQNYVPVIGAEVQLFWSHTITGGSGGAGIPYGANAEELPGYDANLATNCFQFGSAQTPKLPFWSASFPDASPTEVPESPSVMTTDQPTGPNPNVGPCV